MSTMHGRTFPIHAQGDSYSFDSDLWSLGLTMVECALGRFPYPPPSDAGVQLGFWELLEYIVMEVSTGWGWGGRSMLEAM